MRHSVKAILFDLDGVLWSSVSVHRAAFQRALREQGYPWTLSKQEYVPLAGMTTETAFRKFFRGKARRCEGKALAVLSRRKRFWARKYLRDRVKLPAGLSPLLRGLRRFCRLGLVSSSHPKTVKIFLQRSRTRPLFDVILSNRDVPVSKPSPLIYRTALRKLRIKGREALAVEDTPAGVQAAAAAGIPVIGLRGTNTDRMLRRAGAFKIISRLSQVGNHASHS